MATIADELLNDFGDSGDENEEQVDEQDFGLNNAQATVSDAQQNGGMAVDDDEEDDTDIAGGDAPSRVKVDDEETEEETKARVEKMELQNVSDVRSVAGLMKQLEPLLKVSDAADSTCTVVVLIA